MTDKPSRLTKDAAPARDRANERRRALRFLVRLAVVLAAVALIAGLVVKLYVAPPMVAREVEQALGRY